MKLNSELGKFATMEGAHDGDCILNMYRYMSMKDDLDKFFDAVGQFWDKYHMDPFDPFKGTELEGMTYHKWHQF